MGTKLLTGLLATLVAGLAFAGWHVRDYLAEKVASKEALLVVAGQVQYVQDRQIQALLRDINRLEEKKNKTQDDRDTLKYLRETLKEMQEVRKGQKK